jgi:hypothetical protein
VTRRLGSHVVLIAALAVPVLLAPATWLNQRPSVALAIGVGRCRCVALRFATAMCSKVAVAVAAIQ